MQSPKHLTISDFVKDCGGDRAIQKVLIANNGIAAVKEIRSIRKWAYETFGNERAIHFTVMATPEDLSHNAEYIRLADRYVDVPGGGNHNNFANVDLIVDVAQRSGCDAVWPGWGHSSENPLLPDALAAVRIVFIGPPSSAMRSLGDKISSTIVAQSAHVPTMPWSGSSLKLSVDDKQVSVSVPDGLYKKACVQSVEQGEKAALQIGYPVMIKASEGGGGRGIRQVSEPKDFKDAYDQCCSELPGSPIFVMKLAGNARHLEVQILADKYGNVISLFGRDCSVQRRHQKIIEEAPVTIAPQEVFVQMEKAAVRLSQLVGYVSAGTVEYLYEPDTHNFYFLELNPRLQVEHPCTEMTSGVNLPAAQLLIAMGIPLHRVKDIRLMYGMAPSASSQIDFHFANAASSQIQRKPMPKGHIIAARITAENPDAGFKPSGGSMDELNFRSSTNVWGYFSLNSSGGLHEFADSQFGHLFAYGENRQQARQNMIIALKELSIRGDFRTTVEYLIKLLETEAFSSNKFHTGWLDHLIKNNMTAEKPDTFIAVTCGAVSKAFTEFEAKRLSYLDSLKRGQVASRSLLRTNLQVDIYYQSIIYHFQVQKAGPDYYDLSINGSVVRIHARPLNDGSLLIQFNNNSYTTYAKDEVSGAKLIINGKTCMLEKDNDPTQLRSSSSGKITRLLVKDGEHVHANGAYAELEVMKMCMPLISSEAGTIKLLKQVGSTVKAGDCLAILTLDDPSKVTRAVTYTEQFPSYTVQAVHALKPYQKYNLALQNCQLFLSGYDQGESQDILLDQLVAAIEDRELLRSSFVQVYSTIRNRVPVAIDDQVQSLLVSSSFEISKVQSILGVYVGQNNDPAYLSQLLDILAPLMEVTIKYSKTPEERVVQCFIDLIDGFYLVEQVFDKVDDYLSRGSEKNTTSTGVILSLRDANKDNLEHVLKIVLAHLKVLPRVRFVMRIMERLSSMSVGQKAEVIALYRKLASLNHSNVAPITLKARELLISGFLPSLEDRQHKLENDINHMLETPSDGWMDGLFETQHTLSDVLVPMFFRDNKEFALAAIFMYVRRAYSAYELDSIQKVNDTVVWKFSLASDSSARTATPSTLQAVRMVSSSLNLSPSNADAQPSPTAQRKGVMVAISNLDSWNGLENTLKHLGRGQQAGIPSLMLNYLYIAVQQVPSQRFIPNNKEMLARYNVRRVTFVISNGSGSQYPSYINFRVTNDGQIDYTEDLVTRNIEPATAYQLELSRLENFKIQPIATANSARVHVYYAQGFDNDADCRFFIRMLARPQQLKHSTGNNMRDETIEYLISLGDHIISEALDELEILVGDKPKADCNQVFVNFVPHFHNIKISDVETALPGFITRHGLRLWRLRVTGAEIRMVVRPDDVSPPCPYRFFLTNISGYVLKIECYKEVKDGEHSVLQTIDPQPGSYHNYSAQFQYQTKEPLQPKRHRAHLMGTTYVYDFPDLFKQAVAQLWKKSKIQCPSDLLIATEYVLVGSDLQQIVRAPGQNKAGMVCWIFGMKTPEYPDAREIVVIANDITFMSGSFGPEEDTLFYKASELARAKGIPRLYLSANSGARIGLAEELMDLYKVQWNNTKDPSQGFEYLYLDQEAYNILLHRCNVKGVQMDSCIVDEQILQDGAVHYKITDIVGLKHGLGVENLQGSGLIAGATSLAYKDIFTLSLVSCRSVGIGAYLVRLGQRTVQIEGHPIILTGAGALNKVLGREVYTSNLQLGGTQIMHNNGISHLTAKDDFHGVLYMLNWLSYVPAQRNAKLPLSLNLSDPVGRGVDYYPPQGSYDVRHIIAGQLMDDGLYLSGLFDKDSFMETLSGWAMGVVVGRARLGGIPCGVIAVETRHVEYVIPADPAMVDSQEQTVQQPGQVWFPNSAFKTAQAINDFNFGEQLPLVILANWRGFSGGMMDMFNEVLKFGAMIVDALQVYKQPVLVYIPPFAELRGGAWVVVDPYINSEMMELYADPTARGGVLEPAGIVEIKYRLPQILALMERLDQEYAELKLQLASDKLDQGMRDRLEMQLKRRIELLTPVYNQIAIQFADLHDTPGRMLAKNVINGIIPWKDARRKLYERLSSRLQQLQKI